MKTNIKDNCLEIRLVPEVTAPWVSERLDKVQDIIKENDSYDNVVVNMEDVGIIDSIGISFIIALFRESSALKKDFKAVNLDDRVYDLFKLMKLNEIFTVEP